MKINHNIASKITFSQQSYNLSDSPSFRDSLVVKATVTVSVCVWGGVPSSCVLNFMMK